MPLAHLQLREGVAGRGTFKAHAAAVHHSQVGFDQGNIYKDNLWEVWNNRFEPFRNREWAHKGECKECKMWKFCLGNGMHLYDNDHNLLHCNYNKLCR